MDGWFKKTFGTENHKRLLQLFLQELIPEHQIVHITLDPTEHVNPYEDKKDIRVDVECHDKDGTRFVVEMQLAFQDDFYERAVFNSSFAVLQQKKKGEPDYDFPSVYVIGILRFSKHEGSDRIVYRYRLREDHSDEVMTDRLQYILLELPNSVRRAKATDANVLEKFCYALYQLEFFSERPAEFKEEIFQLLFDFADLATFTPDERIKYELAMTTDIDRINQLKYARKEGLLQGLEQGRQEGREEGREEGKAEGRAEGAREQSLLIARNLLDAGISADVVVRTTGLSPEEVQGLS